MRELILFLLFCLAAVLITIGTALFSLAAGVIAAGISVAALTALGGGLKVN